MTSPALPIPAAFDSLFAVVLDHAERFNARVRWSPRHQLWRVSNDWGRGWQEPSEEPSDSPQVEQLELATALVDRLEARLSNGCWRCGSTLAVLHFVAPDVHGSPALYCVQKPSPSVVGSSGGSGVKKHWGSPGGCKAVGSFFDDDPTDLPLGPSVFYLYGEPLTAEQVIDWAWCARCTGASGLGGPAGDSTSREWMERQARRDTRIMLGHMAEYSDRRD